MYMSNKLFIMQLYYNPDIHPKKFIPIDIIRSWFMAKKIRSASGSIYCSYCATSVEEDDIACTNCGKRLEPEVIEGRACHACGNPVGKLADECPRCGENLAEENLSDDDEYLTKLLGWGDETEQTLQEKIEEKQKALDVFKKFTGTREDIEGISLESVREPLQRVLEITSKRLEDLDGRIQTLKTRMEEEEENEDIREEIKALSIEKDHLINMEAGIDYMRDAFEAIFKEQHKELQERKGELKERVREFKKVVKKKEEEKERIEKKKEQLKNREDELRKWESQLRAWEEDLVNNENSLEDLKGRYVEGEKILEGIEEELPEEGKVTQEEWLEEQRKIQRELFKLKDMWDENGEVSIPDVDDMSSDNIPTLKEILKKKEKRWKKKVIELEEEIEKIKIEKDALTAGKNLADIEIEEISAILSVLDKLLGYLPDKKIEEFAKSKEFELYEKIMDSLGL